MKNNILKLRSWTIAIAAAFLAVTGFAEYPGNPNFRNVEVTYSAAARKNWVTNILDNALTQQFDWSVGSTLSPGVTFVPVILTPEAGWPRQMVCYCVRIDLTTPGLRFAGTDRCPEGWGDPMTESNSTCAQYASGHYPKRTVREKTSDFLARNRGSKSKGGKERNAVLAWNSAAWLPWSGANTNLWACPYSPLYADGIQISNNRTGGVEVPNLKDPAPQAMFVQLKNGNCGIVDNMTEEMAKQTWFCVPAFVTGLVSGNWAPLDNGDIAPRTAIGISADGKTFYLLVCDGRRDGWTDGCDFTSLSKILYGMGTWVGFNLDGGGSTTLCRWNESNNKVDVMNRPSGNSLRDMGSNMAIYYDEPVAILGDYTYENFDFLVQDVIDGESPKLMTEVDVIRDAEFTAEHPYIPVNGFTFCSTNNSSIGWADGVTPQVAPDCSVTFRNIRFRDLQSPLSIPAGSTAILDGVDGLTAISSANAAGIVIAGSVPAGMRVSCTAAPAIGDVFASTTLAIDAARVEAKKILCATDETLVAEAVTVGSAVKLRWTKIVTFGGQYGKIAETLDRGIVNVRASECGSEYLSGYKLKLTVASEDGLRTAIQLLDFAGPGEYVFDTTGASDPTICAVGYGYSYKIEFVDADGEQVAFTSVLSGRMGLGVEKLWFKAFAADDSAVGGSWTAKPAITNGVYDVTETSDADFLASAQKDGRVRFEMDAVFRGYMTESRAQAALGQFAEYGTPHGACFPAKVDSDGNLAWRALVNENGSPALKTLYGPVPINTPCKVITDVDWSSGAPRVRYSVMTGSSETVLVDAGGEIWFAGASSAESATGRMVASGTGSVASLCGKAIARKLLKRFNITIR